MEKLISTTTIKDSQSCRTLVILPKGGGAQASYNISNGLQTRDKLLGLNAIIEKDKGVDGSITYEISEKWKLEISETIKFLSSAGDDVSIIFTYTNTGGGVQKFQIKKTDNKEEKCKWFVSFYNNCPIYSDFIILVDEDNKIIKFDISYSELDFKPLEKPVENEDEGRILESRQKIYYGAPGTGKSHEIKDLIKKYSIDEKTQVFRTTFHPDSDYSTFVGVYKPTMDKVKKTVIIGETEKDVKPESYEDKIIYTFTSQSFLKAYIAAWNALLEQQPKPIVLVIEEINRGNCAQIFGDLFQLLDRNENGVSEYPIKADDDLCKLLEHGKDKSGDDLLKNKDGIANGELCLPPNLYIWATMNTSDQSLFPIDSAFKRRWDWVYMPIKNVGKNWEIKVEDEKETKVYDWWKFLDAVNEVIAEETNSEDKKLGYFFCKADNDNVISLDKFIGKVLFYLWNDVFKMCGKEYKYITEKKDKDGKFVEKLLTFDKFYTEKNQAKLVQDWLEKDLGVKPKTKETTTAAVAVEETTTEGIE